MQWCTVGMVVSGQWSVVLTPKALYSKTKGALRALETGRYLLRAANDGVTAIITPQGKVKSSLPQFRPGVLQDVVEPRQGLTPYARTGNVPIVVFCAAALLLGGLYRHRRRTRH